MSRDVFEQVRFFKRRGVPIIAINSVDPIALVKELAYRLCDHPVFTWDAAVGIEPGRKRNADNPAVASPNELADRTWQQLGTVVNAITGAHGQALKGAYEVQGKGLGLGQVLQLAREIPSSTGTDGVKLCPVFICKHVNQLLHGTSGHLAQQAIMNIRDYYAATGRTLILIDNDIELPECLRADTIVLEESLPSQEEYRSSVEKICRSAKIKLPKDIQPIVDAVAGLPLFQAEQALSLSLTSDGFDIQILWSEKKKLVDQTQGLSVHYQGEGFKAVGGLAGIKQYIRRLMNGPKPPQLIVWIDEIEKTGIAHTGDLNGINADTLGVMLSYIEDHNAYCVSLTGLPGTGKSMIAKAVGAEFGRMVIRMDLGAMKGSFVGQTESNFRAALRVITSLGQDNVLFLATSNTINSLDAALRSRFRDTFYFPLPTSEELRPVWDIHMAKYGMTDEIPDDTNWVPRNVKHCVEKAYRLGMPLAEAAETVIPTGQSMVNEVHKLNEQASGRFLDASTGKAFGV